MTTKKKFAKMKVFYPIFRWLVLGCLIAVALVQQYCWWSTDYVNSGNWFLSIVWFAILVSGSVMLAYTLFPRQNPTAKHKFRCTFYTIKHGKYIRVCTRTYKSIWLYCFKQVRKDLAMFFTIKQLDK